MSNNMPEGFGDNPAALDAEKDAKLELTEEEVSDNIILPCPLAAQQSMVVPPELVIPLGAHPIQMLEPKSAAEFAASLGDKHFYAPTIERLGDLFWTLAPMLPHGSPQREALGIAMAIGHQVPGGCKFANIDPSTVARQMMLRIANPALVDQGVAGSCGPAAFAIQFIRFDPVGYSLCVASLLTTGQGRIGTLVLKPHDAILQHGNQWYDKKEEKFYRLMPEVDWIFLASLRNHVQFSIMKWGNVIHSTKSTLGATPLDKLFTWCTQSGYSSAIAVKLGADQVGDRDVAPSFYPAGAERDFGETKSRALETAMAMLASGWLLILEGDAFIAFAAEEAYEAAKAQQDLNELREDATSEEKRLAKAAYDEHAERAARYPGRRGASHYMVMECLEYAPGSGKKQLSYTVTTWTKTYTYDAFPTEKFLSRIKGLLLLRGHETVNHEDLA